VTGWEVSNDYLKGYESNSFGVLSGETVIQQRTSMTIVDVLVWLRTEHLSDTGYKHYL
jgi:hypothetical protein